MGVVKNITAIEFPSQTYRVGGPATLCFHHDSTTTVKATIMRDDAEEPFVTIFKTVDGRHILATECQYQLL